MNFITTVLGDIPVSNLGHCQPHEHVYIVETPALLTNEELKINNLAASINELRLYKSAGGNSVVDAQPIATGRDARALADASRQSGVNIIACTGYHIPVFYNKDHWIYTAGEDELVELFTVELTKGMFLGGCYSWPYYQTDIKAGAVKAMLNRDGVSGRVEVLLRAAGRAACKAGTALILHTEFGKGVLDALNLLDKVGLSPERVLVSHVDRQANDYGIHREIAATGAYLIYDTVTLFEYHDNDSEIKLIMHMIEQGYGDRLLISTDPTKDRLKSYGGQVGMDYILTEFLPKLRRASISEDIVQMLVRDNPARALKRIAMSFEEEGITS